MITFREESRVFHLRGRGYSYIMKVSDEGILTHLYYGAPIPEGDVEYLEKELWDGASFDRRDGRIPFELPTQEMGCYTSPALACESAEGDDVVSLRYEGYEISDGKPPLRGLPASYAEDNDKAMTLKVFLRDKLTGLRVTLVYCAREEYGVLTRSLLIENNGKAALTLRGVSAASLPLPGTDYDMVCLEGAWARERYVKRARLPLAKSSVESRRGASGHEYNCFLALCAPSATEDHGKVYAVTHVYSGSFLASAECTNFGRVWLEMGMNPATFAWKLSPNDTFQSPEALMVFSDEGLSGMSRAFHPFIRERVCRGAWRDRPRPVLINNWEATYFNFNEEKLAAIMEKAADIGCELFVLDDGWFGKRDDDHSSLGDWKINLNKLPNGLNGVARTAKKYGMAFGLWFEPEMVSPDSDLYRAHPDWCLHVDGRARSEARNQLILDLGREEVQDYLIGEIFGVLKSADISYVKWDMNRNMTEGFSACLPREQKMESQHRYMLGLYRVLEAITSAFPDILFESCSGGGGRFDCGMLYYMPQTWTSDDTDAAERLKIQYGTSFLYPPSSMGAHVSASPNHQTGRPSSMKMRADVALGGNFGFELDLSKLSDEDLSAASEAVKMVKRLRGLTLTGIFDRLESPFEKGRAAWQLTAKDGSAFILCAYQTLCEPNPVPRRLYPRGLDASAAYVCDGMRYSGAALMNAGVSVPRARRDMDSRVMIFIREDANAI